MSEVQVLAVSCSNRIKTTNGSRGRKRKSGSRPRLSSGVWLYDGLNPMREDCRALARVYREALQHDIDTGEVGHSRHSQQSEPRSVIANGVRSFHGHNGSNAKSHPRPVLDNSFSLWRPGSLAQRMPLHYMVNAAKGPQAEAGHATVRGNRIDCAVDPSASKR